jgi:hypothetical protein
MEVVVAIYQGGGEHLGEISGIVVVLPEEIPEIFPG